MICIILKNLVITAKMFFYRTNSKLSIGRKDIFVGLSKLFQVENMQGRKIIRILGIKFTLTPTAGNKVYLVKDGKRRLALKKIKGLTIIFKGRNNVVEIEYPNHFINSKIYCLGDDNYVSISQTKHTFVDLFIKLCDFNKNRQVIIKENVSTGGLKIRCHRNNSKVLIGSDCMFSWDVTLNAGDGHQVIDINDGRVVNDGNFCEIGNHVWVGQKAIICKNVKISDNSIVGAGSVVTKSPEQPNVVIAGNPAKVVKTGITWKRDPN